MPTVVEIPTCEGFAVETPERRLGWVEESGRRGLVVRTPDGLRGVLPRELVQAIDPDAQEVLVGHDAALVDLDVQRRSGRDRPLWQTIALALAVIAAIASAQMGVDFLVAWLVTGHPY